MLTFHGGYATGVSLSAPKAAAASIRRASQQDLVVQPKERMPTFEETTNGTYYSLNPKLSFGSALGLRNPSAYNQFFKFAGYQFQTIYVNTCLFDIHA